MVKLVVSKSDKKDKKLKAVFTYDDGKTKTTHLVIVWMTIQSLRIRNKEHNTDEDIKKTLKLMITRGQGIYPIIFYGETAQAGKLI